jgi:hypothetical protein
MPDELQVGDLVEFQNDDRRGVGIVTSPIAVQRPGHVLTLRGDELIGVAATIEDVRLADEDRDGYVQLAVHLIKLGSHVIEGRIVGMTLPHLQTDRRGRPA